MESLKLESYLGENVTYCCAKILVDAYQIESSMAQKSDHLGYITCIIEDTSDYRFRLWAIQKYKEVTEFIKKILDGYRWLSFPRNSIKLGKA